VVHFHLLVKELFQCLTRKLSIRSRHAQATCIVSIHKRAQTREAERIRTIGKELKGTAERLFSGFDVADNQSLVRELSGRADKYASSLSRYWSYARERTSDIYLHQHLGGPEWHADVGWFERTNDAFKEVDRTLGEQLTKWEALTSPYADKIDVRAISSATHSLWLTIETALAKTKAEGLPDNPQDKAEYAYKVRMSIHLAALSQQIGKRLEAMGSGTPQPAGATKQMSDFLERTSGMAELGERFNAEANDLQALQEELAKIGFTPESLDQMRTRQAELIQMLRGQDLSTGKWKIQLAAQQKIEASLETWRRSRDLVSMSNTQREVLMNAVTDLNEAVKKLGQTLDDDSRTEWMRRRGERAAKLLKLETPFFSRVADGVTQQADEARKRSDRYQQALADAQDAASANNLGDVWSDVKNRCLKESSAVSGKETATALDKAFDGGLSSQLTTWEKKFAMAARQEAPEILNLASNLAETIDAYSTRASYIMETNPELEEVHDRLQCGLKVIRDTVTGDLRRRLDQGVFGSPFS